MIYLINKILLLSILSSCVLTSNAQLFKPFDDSVVLGNFFISWQNKGTQTDYEVSFILDKTSPLASLSNFWFAIGFNRNPIMVNLLLFLPDPDMEEIKILLFLPDHGLVFLFKKNLI